ncbi:hypothetical protein LIER_19648 [Lithospermum erythrorhizon]|uniref:Uncharacterized protein n=1 Tax=Lithospermum erythrorhizon TaxID=34254 RepID=A0AAV3QLL1_LITER
MQNFENGDREIDTMRAIKRVYKRGGGGSEKPQGHGSSPPRHPSYKQKNSPQRHHPYRRQRSPYRPRTDKKTMERRESSPVARHIATIAGGIHGGGDSRNARKKYARRKFYGVVDFQVGTEEMTFTDVDCQGLEMPHDDPLVIAPKIAHYTVERMKTHPNSYEGYSVLGTLKIEVPDSRGSRRNDWGPEMSTRVLPSIYATTKPRRSELGVKA